MKSHYETLELQKNCTAEEIKNSYIKLSKKYHPDKNKNSDAHKKFVQINEAYSVLGRTGSRLKYDESLKVNRTDVRTSRTQNNPPRYPPNYYNYSYSYRARETVDPGLFNKKSKLTAVFFCCIIMLVGAGFHLQFDQYRKKMKSKTLPQILEEVNRRREQYGTREQAIKGFQSRIYKDLAEKDLGSGGDMRK